MSRLPSRLWSLQETAEFLGVPSATLYQWLSRNCAPRSYKVGRYRRFDPTDVQVWLDERVSHGDTAA